MSDWMRAPGRRPRSKRRRPWLGRAHFHVGSALLFAWAILAKPADAAPDDDGVDRFDLWAHGETNAILFRRALLPGPDGSIVETNTVFPLRHDVRLQVRDLDTALSPDSLDIELSAWALSTLGEPGLERPVQGDVQTANVGYRQGPLRLRLGRQHAAGGAARYARFDGADADLALGAGFDVGAYGGFVVLPQWDRRPGYFALGAAADAVRRDPGAIPAPERGDHFLVGGHVGWRGHKSDIDLSVHEQQATGGVSRRNLGATARTVPFDAASLGGNVLVELDSGRLADGRAWVDTEPLDELSVSAEYLHTEPALLLSRQSVVSVFSTAAYDEAGGFAVLRPAQRLLSIEGGGYVQFYETGHPGARGEIAGRLAADRSMKTTLRLGYGRLLAPDNGYHNIRVSVARRLTDRLSTTAEGYFYFYDEPIRAASASSLYAAMLSWQAMERLGVLFGASAAQSPYAALDAQAQLRLSYDFDFGTRRRVR